VTFYGETKNSGTGTLTGALLVDGKDYALQAVIHTGDGNVYVIRKPQGPFPLLLRLNLDKLPKREISVSSGFSQREIPDNQQAMRSSTLNHSLGTGISPTVVTVLVMFTDVAEREEGGLLQIKALIRTAELQMNIALKKSDTNTAIAVVQMKRLVYDESESPEQILERLRCKSEGCFDEVHSLRDQAKADLVSLIIDGYNDPTLTAGLSFRMERGENHPSFESSAFSVVRRSNAISVFSFAHELAHNFGCCHAREPRISENPVFDFAYGYSHPEGKFGSIMGGPSNKRVLRYSNPNIDYGGVTMGDAETNNATTINWNGLILQSFR
jgi:hypothetical protein